MLPLSSKATRATLWQSADYSWWFCECALCTIPTPLSCLRHQRTSEEPFTLRAGDVLSPCPTPKGKEGTNTTWVVLEWKVQTYHFTKFRHQHSDKPINKGYKQRRAKFCKVSVSHYQSGYFQIKNAQPNGYACIYQNDIIKNAQPNRLRNRVSKLFNYRSS